MSVAPSSDPHWSVGDSLARVMDALQGHTTRVRELADGSFRVSCINPGHSGPDNNPSLHVSHVTTPHGGRVLFRCFACGDGPTQTDWAIWAGLEYDDLFDDRRRTGRPQPSAGRGRPRTKAPASANVGRLGPLPKKIVDDLPALLEQETSPLRERAGDDEHTHRWENVETYLYRRPDNTPVQRVVRQRCTDEDCSAKNFPQQFLTRGGNPDTERSWVDLKAKAGWGSDWEPVLYRYPQVLAAIEDGLPVWVLEGEKDVHAAEECAVVATTNPSGGATFPEPLARVLAGASEVNVVLDRDKVGWARGVKLVKLIEAAGGPRPRLWLPATTDPKSDLSDHLDAGHTLAELVPVSLPAVTAWHLLTEVLAGAAATIDTACVEAQAQLQVADHARAKGRKAKAEERGRFATRWAKEALRQHARLAATGHELVEAVAKVSPGDATHAWAMEALEIAQGQLRTATTMVHTVCDLTKVQVPPGVDEARLALPAPAAEPEPATTDPGGAGESRPDLQIVRGGGDSGGGGGEDDTPGVFIQYDVYRIISGELVQVRWVTAGDSMRKTYKRVVNAPLRVRTREMAESDDDIDLNVFDIKALGGRDGREAVTQVKNLTRVTHVVLEIPGSTPADEPRLVRIPFDDWVTGAFLPHLPIVGLDYNGGRTGREKVVTAVNHVSTPELRTSYRATGWRVNEDGTATYITASGAIDKDGWSPVPTNLSGPLARYDLPNPVQDPARLREAFLTGSAPLMDLFPDRVGAVLIGQAFRAALCPNEWATVLAASPGTGKTGLAALGMHYFGEGWDRMRPLSSMSGNGATMNALRIMLNQAKDALVLLDDNAPTAGVEQAWKRLEETIRLIHNQEGRARSERDGQGALPESKPRTSAIITTELPARAGTSGERRGLLVPLTRRDIDVADIVRLDDLGLRHRRALLMSSYLQWLAGDYRGHLLRAGALREDFRTWLAGETDQRTFDAQADKVTELAAGWGLLLEFLTEVGAITAAEQDQWHARVYEALVVTAEAAHDPDMVETTGQRAAELLRFALANGMAYAADADTGGAPAGYEKRLGWRAVTVNPTATGLGSSSEWRADPRAISLGYVQHTPSGPELLCDRAGLDAVIKAAASSMTDTSNLDLGTMLRAFEDEGVLKVREERRRGGTIVRRTLDRTIGCLPSMSDPTKPLREKRIVLRLTAVFGEGGTGDVPPTPPAVPDQAPPTQPAPISDPAPAEQLPIEEPPSTPHHEEVAVQHYTTAGGLELASVAATNPTACAAATCDLRCGITFAGIPLHIRCFVASTARTVEELRAEHQAPTAKNAPVPPTKPAAGTGARQLAGSGSFRASVVVVDVDAVYLPDGTREALPFPITHLGDLEELGRHLQIGHAPLGWKKVPQAGMLVPTPALWRHLGVDYSQIPAIPSKRAAWLSDLSADLPAITQAVEAGWVFGKADAAPVLKMTTKLRRHDVARGSVTIVMTHGLPEEWGVGEGCDPARVARVLQLVATAFGIPFGGSPINAALDAFEALTPLTTRELMSAVNWDEVTPARIRELERHFDFTRAPLQDETATAKRVVFFDRGQSYLAGWGGLLLGVGAPDHHEGPVTFNEKCAGWWRVTLPADTVDGQAQTRLFPDLLDPDGTQAGKERWVTTPTLAYARKNLDVDLEIHEAWIWPADRSKRVLEPLYNHIRSALEALRAIDDDDARHATTIVKAIYKQFSGYVISANAEKAQNGMSQPYWFHAMIAQARVGILHQVLTIGQRNSLDGRTNVWPVVVSNTDLVGYLSDSDDNDTAWPGAPDKIGFTPGKYKLTRAASLADQLPYLTGRGWSGRDATSELGRDIP